MTNLKRNTSALLVVLGLLMLGLLTGCGVNQIEPKETEVEVEEPTVEVEETEVALEDRGVAASDIYTPEVLAAFRKTCDTFENKPENVRAMQKKIAIEDWTENGVTDWDMVDYIIEKQMENYHWFLSEVNRTDFDGTVNEEIIIMSLATWSYDFEMIKYDYEKQVTAYLKVN